MKCNNCEKEVEELKEGLCETCFNESYFECTYCNKICEIDDSRVDDNNNLICEDCFDEHFSYCDSCSSLVHREDSYISPNDEYLCSNCFSISYAYCGSCSEPLTMEYSYYCEYCNEYYHDECICNCDEEEIPQSIHPYDYKPIPIFHGNKGPFYGIEIETDHYATRDRAIDELSGYDSFYLKHDGSLEYGIEIVTHPRNIDEWMGYRDTLSTIKKTVLKNGGKSFKARTCGLHVHRSRDDINQIQELKLIWLYTKCKEHINKISQRESPDYASFYMGQETTIKKTFKRVKDKYHKDNRHQALNFNNRNTVEFRTFKGTLNIDTIYAYIGFVHYIVEYTKNILINNLHEEESDKLWADFIEFVHNKLKKEVLSRYLFNYIGHKNLIQNKRLRGIE